MSQARSTNCLERRSSWRTTSTSPCSAKPGKGSAKSAQNAAFLAIGSGVGLGLIVNGQLVRGAKGAAGEIAYLPIGARSNSARARATGAFELEVGAAGILRRYAESALSEIDDVRELFDRLHAGDRAAAETTRRDGPLRGPRPDRGRGAL